jgi:hypothetical protein
MGEKHDEERAAPDLGSGNRRTRTETVDHAQMLKALKEAFEAGGAASRHVIEAQSGALKDAYAEIARLHGACGSAIGKSQELVERLKVVAGQNIALTLAEGASQERVQEQIQKGENTRHALTLAATNPFLGVVIQKFLPGLSFTPPRPPGEGNTPKEAAERFAASLRSGSEGAQLFVEAIKTYCEEEIGRPGDFALLLEFFAGAVGGSSVAEQKGEAA